MSTKRNVQVIIAGKIYTLSGYETEEYLQRVAAYLNSRITELSAADGYHRMHADMKAILLNLNIADDYFKTRKKVEELEAELTQRDREIYDFKHELITAQIQLENLQKDVKRLEEKNASLQREKIQLEARFPEQL